MKKYTNLVFDADDTLLDFEAAEYYALKDILEQYKYEMSEEIRQQYRKINIELWEKYEEGIISKEEVLHSRFEKLFNILEMKVNGEEIEKQFREKLGECSTMIKDASIICEKLYKNYNLYIVSNGVKETQIKRLKESGLDTYMKNIFISEEIGYQKPRIEFIKEVQKVVPNINSTNTLIIGDTLTSDIKLGENTGIDTCWFNPNKKENKSKIKPTYEIQELRQLISIINEKKATI